MTVSVRARHFEAKYIAGNLTEKTFALKAVKDVDDLLGRFHAHLYQAPDAA